MLGYAIVSAAYRSFVYGMREYIAISSVPQLFRLPCLQQTFTAKL